MKKPRKRNICEVLLFNRGSRNRTHIDGFGDHCSTFELCPYEVVFFSRLLNYSISIFIVQGHFPFFLHIIVTFFHVFHETVVVRYHYALR